MRIKISTAGSLPKNQCWFPINEKLKKQPIHQLAKKIANQLNLSTEAANLKLSIDDFNLMPQTTIKDVLRDGDLVLIKEDPVGNLTVSKKRKSPVSPPPTKTEEDDELDTRPLKKTKKSKSSTTKNNDKVKDTPTEKVGKETRKQKEQKSKGKTKEKKSEQIEDTVEKAATTKENKQGAPFDGLEKTKKRNMRRRALKQNLRLLQDESNSVETNFVAQTKQQPQIKADNYIVHELHVEKLKITPNEPSETLLKKNKNKKKNHLKGAKAENRSHVYYQQDSAQDDIENAVDMDEVSNPDTVAMQQDNIITSNKHNLYGRAFVTSVESEPKYKGRRGPERQYPIHKVPTLFYAEKPAVEEEPPQTTLVAQTAADDKPVNYDSLPIADFESKIPAIGDRLAIKTLELTANYTPEISDWKQVILKEWDLPNTVTFEYIQGFGKTSTKGGKFDIKKHQKKKYDDWYQDEYDQTEHDTEQVEDSELVNEDEQEQDMITVPIADVFAMKNMSKV